MERMLGQRVLVTGASRGVGLSAALAFGREGADVAVLARPSPALDDAVARVAATGVRAVRAEVDLTDRAAVRRGIPAAIKELGGLDVLVSNAAAVVFGPFDLVSPDDFDHAVAASFTGAVDAVTAALPALRDSCGAIVATGSLMSRLPLPMFSSYAAAKHALRGYLLTLREELIAEQAGVDVSIVHPGAVATPLWHQVTSATGALPRFPPEGYRPETIAEVLVERALSPRAETVVGAEARAIELLLRAVPPVGDLALRAIHLWFASGREPARGEGALWNPPPGADRTTRLWGRPSALATLASLVPWFGLGRGG